MAVLTIELLRDEVEDVGCDERCVWCEDCDEVARTVDGFCEFCGATGHDRV